MDRENDRRGIKQGDRPSLRSSGLGGPLVLQKPNRLEAKVNFIVETDWAKTEKSGVDTNVKTFNT